MWRLIKKTSPYREKSQKQYLFLSTSCDEHGISETEEAVAFLDGVFIGIKDEFTASKGWNQHHQGWLWKVEVGWKGIYDCELITWFDKDIGPARVGLELAIIFISNCFQCSDWGYRQRLGWGCKILSASHVRRHYRQKQVGRFPVQRGGWGRPILRL